MGERRTIIDDHENWVPSRSIFDACETEDLSLDELKVIPTIEQLLVPLVGVHERFVGDDKTEK